MNNEWSCNLLQNTDMNWEGVLKYLLPFKWQRECCIIPNYLPPFHDPDQKPIVVIRHGNSFLRHSGGPHTGTFWDVYGDDFGTPELALIELSKAPPPWKVAPRIYGY